MKNFLDIHVSTSPDTLRIPCALLDLRFSCFLPGAGLCVIDAALTTPKPVSAQVASVEARRENGAGELVPVGALSESDAKFALAGAHTVLEEVLRGLGINTATRTPHGFAQLSAPMKGIATTWDMEQSTVAAAHDLWQTLMSTEQTQDLGSEFWEQVPDLTDPTDSYMRRSPACFALRGWVQHLTDRACDLATQAAELEAKNARSVAAGLQ